MTLMNRYSKMGIALLAGTWLLVGCSGGGGGGTPTTPPGDDPPINNGGPPSGENGTPPSNENGTTPPGGTPPPGGTGTGTGTGTTTGTTTGTGTGTIINTGGALFGILWPNPDFDSNEPVSEENPEQVRYAFKASYTIPEGETEREVYITEIERDADYADQTAQDISRQINDIRTGANRDEGTSGPTLVAWQGSTRTIIRDARGISAGLDTAAMEDIAAIDALIARYERLRKQAEMAKEALETARDGERTSRQAPVRG